MPRRVLAGPLARRALHSTIHACCGVVRRPSAGPPHRLRQRLQAQLRGHCQQGPHAALPIGAEQDLVGDQEPRRARRATVQGARRCAGVNLGDCGGFWRGSCGRIPEKAARSLDAAAGEDGEAARMTPLPAPSRRALELLATSPQGWTVPFLAAHDVPSELVFNLIRQGLAVAKTEGVRPAEITRIQITAKGRGALESPAAP
jgi:hypothetical protein